MPMPPPVLLSRLLKPARSQLSCILRSYNSWASAIREASSPHEALRFFSRMQRLSIPFDTFSIVFLLKSCAPLHDLPIIHHLHAHILKLGFLSHAYAATSLLNAYARASFGDACQLFDQIPERSTATWNAMITGYSKSGDVERARLVFEEMPARDIASWSALIAGYIGNGNGDRGLSLLGEMLQNEQLKPDQATLGSVLSGCGHMGYLGLQAGKSLHSFIVKNAWELNVELGTALVDMYAKCGFLKSAFQVFESMQERNVISWTALICGSAQHGYGNDALSLFGKMCEMGVRPNEMTFTGILSACVQTGLIEEGRKFFNLITECGMEPRVQHYGCMVDMLGKGGQLQDAYEMIMTMKAEPNAVVWCSFLSACKVHKQFEMAEKVIGQILRTLTPENGGVYTLISDIYALCGKWSYAEKVRKLMVHQYVKKVRGSSFIGSGEHVSSH